MTLQENRSIARRVFEEAVNQGDMRVVDECFGLGPGTGQFIHQLRQDLPGLHVTVEDMLAEDDKVATRETWHGTHAATGTRIEGMTLHIFWMDKGRVVKAWSKGWEWLDPFEKKTEDAAAN